MIMAVGKEPGDRGSKLKDQWEHFSLRCFHKSEYRWTDLPQATALSSSPSSLVLFDLFPHRLGPACFALVITRAKQGVLRETIPCHQITAKKKNAVIFF